MEKTISNLLQSYEQGKLTRRDLVAGLTLLASGANFASAAPASTIQAVSVNHIAMNVGDVKRSTEFYRDVFGLTVTMQNDKSSALLFGNTGLILRRGEKPGVTHFMFGINDYDADGLAGTLKARGLDPRKDQDSFHVKDPDGLDVQVGDKDMRGTSQAPEGQRHLTPKATSK